MSSNQKITNAFPNRPNVVVPLKSRKGRPYEIHDENLWHPNGSHENQNIKHFIDEATWGEIEAQFERGLYKGMYTSFETRITGPGQLEIEIKRNMTMNSHFIHAQRDFNDPKCPMGLWFLNGNDEVYDPIRFNKNTSGLIRLLNASVDQDIEAMDRIPSINDDTDYIPF
jgi:hypothetical protein